MTKPTTKAKAAAKEFYCRRPAHRPRLRRAP